MSSVGTDTAKQHGNWPMTTSISNTAPVWKRDNFYMEDRYLSNMDSGQFRYRQLMSIQYRKGQISIWKFEIYPIWIRDKFDIDNQCRSSMETGQTSMSVPHLDPAWNQDKMSILTARMGIVKKSQGIQYLSCLNCITNPLNIFKNSL